ncbi:MAG: hypothetical protein WA790_11855 [Sulfitobacter sp.]
MTPELELFTNITSAAGIAILSVPAFSLNFRKKTLDRITRILAKRKPGEERSALDTIADELEMEAALKANRWRRLDECCLYLGYSLLLGASIFRVFLTI